MQRLTGLASVMALALALLVITGRAAVLSAAPSTEECIERWNGALDDETVELDVRPRGVHLTSQGAASWDGRYPVCWLTIVESGHACQLFYTLAGDAMRWGSDPIDTCEPPILAERDTALQPMPDGRIAIREP